MILHDADQLSSVLQLALEAFENGDFAEASKQTGAIINDLSEIDDVDERTGVLYLKLIDVYLRSSEFSVVGTKNDSGSHWDTVATKGVEVAKKIGVKTWLGRMMGLQGKIMRATKGYKHAIVKMQNGLDLLRNTDDTVGQFILMSELGHLVIHEDLQKGVNQLHDAHRYYLSEVEGHSFTDPNIVIKRTFHRLEGFIGIGELDLNNLGNARPFIERSIVGLRNLGMRHDLLRMLNFRAQLAMSIGAFEDAERTIWEVLELRKDEQPSAWQAYNRSMLGKLYLEWEKSQEARPHLEQAYDDMVAFTNADLTPLVNNYYTEYLVNYGEEKRALLKAKEIIAETLALCDEWGAVRGTIVARYLLARAMSKSGKQDSALSNIQSAVDLINQYGILPVVRVEEIYFFHYNLLKESGNRDSTVSLKQAFEVLMNKANTIHDNDQKQQMLSRIPVSRNIIRAYREEYS